MNELRRWQANEKAWGDAWWRTGKNNVRSENGKMKNERMNWRILRRIRKQRVWTFSFCSLRVVRSMHARANRVHEMCTLITENGYNSAVRMWVSVQCGCSTASNSTLRKLVFCWFFPTSNKRRRRNASSSWFYWNENTLSRAPNAIPIVCIPFEWAHTHHHHHVTEMSHHLSTEIWTKWASTWNGVTACAFGIQFGIGHAPYCTFHQWQRQLNFYYFIREKRNAKLRRPFIHFNLINAVEILRSQLAHKKPRKRNENDSNFSRFSLCNFR